MRRKLILIACSLTLGLTVSVPDAAFSAPQSQEAAVLRLATQKLADAAIEDLILRTLAGRGIDTRGATIDFSGLSATSAVAADADLGIDRMTYQENTRQFVAVILAAAPGAPPQRISAIGRLHQDVQVPVPSRHLQVGEVITAGDLEWAPMRDRRLPANAVYDPDDLIGRTPRRRLSPGTPVTMADLKRPVLVTKGSAVTLILTLANMRLTARGQALEDGAVGQTIRVSNVQSRTVVTGVVLADGHVAVGDAPVGPANSR